MKKTPKRNRYISIILFVISIVIGLSSRKFAEYLPEWNRLYFGDIIWAFMVYYLFASVFVQQSEKFIILIALAFSFSIEFSQLYQAEWINTLRFNRLFALILGRGFLWSDLLAYTAGILIAFGIDKRFLQSKK